MTMKVTPSELAILVESFARAGKNLLVVGPPGCAKTAVMNQVADKINFDLLIDHPSTADPTDNKGYPDINAAADHAEFKPFGNLYKALNATKPTIWFLDDFGQALHSVQASYMQLMGPTKRLNNFQLPDCVCFMAASNRRKDKAAVMGMIEPLKSRFATIVEMKISYKDWRNWAFLNRIRPEVIDFLRFREDMLFSFNPTLDFTNGPSPRGWEQVSNILDMNLPNGLQRAAIEGAVGGKALTEFTKYLIVFNELPDLDVIVNDPMTATVPTEPDTIWALATALVNISDQNSIDSISRYAERLPVDFGRLVMFGVSRAKPELMNTSAYGRWTAKNISLEL